MSPRLPKVSPLLPVERRRKYKVDAALATELRRRVAARESYRALAREYHVDRATIRYWTKHVDYAPLLWVSRSFPFDTPAPMPPAPTASV